MRMPKDTAKRQLSEIKFTHWWRKKRGLTRAGMEIDEAKAAMIYEAMRRRPEVQQAWLEGKFMLRDNGWPNFVIFVVQNLPTPWIELDTMTKQTFIECIAGPWFVPPKGYSTFPETNKAEQRKAALQVLRLPATDDPDEALAFVKHARLFEDAGFLVMAVDNKTRQSVRCAGQAIEALSRSFRKADMKEVIVHKLPRNISAADSEKMERKQRQGNLTQKDFDKVWAKYRQPTSSLNAEWHVTAEVRQLITDKRQRKGGLIESKRFDFLRICRELEDFDAGKGLHSGFVQSIRLH